MTAPAGFVTGLSDHVAGRNAGFFFDTDGGLGVALHKLAGSFEGWAGRPLFAIGGQAMMRAARH